jgi:RNA polymerase sigma factor (sigma-70 family)
VSAKARHDPHADSGEGARGKDAVSGSQKNDAAGRSEESNHRALMGALADDARTASLFAKVCLLARARYGILAQDAEDLFHESVVTYLAVHQRYPPEDNHFGILVGIFHKKCLEFLDHQQRMGRVTQRFVARLVAERPDLARGEDPEGAAVDRVVRGEDAEMIRAAIASLSAEAREMLLTLAEGRMTRLELVEVLGINRNTFDTRLRGVRLRLRRVLADNGVI